MRDLCRHNAQRQRRKRCQRARASAGCPERFQQPAGFAHRGAEPAGASAAGSSAAAFASAQEALQPVEQLHHRQHTLGDFQQAEGTADCPDRCHRRVRVLCDPHQRVLQRAHHIVDQFLPFIGLDDFVYFLQHVRHRFRQLAQCFQLQRFQVVFQRLVLVVQLLKRFDLFIGNRVPCFVDPFVFLSARCEQRHQVVPAFSEDSLGSLLLLYGVLHRHDGFAGLPEDILRALPFRADPEQLVQFFAVLCQLLPCLQDVVDVRVDDVRGFLHPLELVHADPVRFRRRFQLVRPPGGTHCLVEDCLPDLDRVLRAFFEPLGNLFNPADHLLQADLRADLIQAVTKIFCALGCLFCRVSQCF